VGATDFLTTRWTEIRTAAGSSPEARAALERFCCGYWYPLYAFLRRDGHDADGSTDLVQGFFAVFLARNDLAGLEPGRGRFRSYLLGALKHHVMNERRRAGALARGGGERILSLDSALDPRDAEARYAQEPATSETPETLYERRFAHALLAAALERLRLDEVRSGREREFEALRPALAGDAVEGGYARLAEELGTTEGALKTAVHRLRKRYRGALVDEVARLVDRPQDVEDELRHLLLVLSDSPR